MTNMVYDCDIENSAYHVISMGKTVEEAYKVMQGLVSKELLEQMYYDYHSTKGDLPKKAKKTRTVIVENNGKIEAIKVPVEETKAEEVKTEIEEEVKTETPAVRENDAEGKSLDEIKEMAKAHAYLLHNNGVRHAKKLIGAMESWMNLEVKDDRSTRKACKIVWDDGTETEVKSYESAMKSISSTADNVITSDNISVKMLEGLVPMDITINIPARRKNWIKQGIEQLLIKVGTAVNNVKVVCLYSGN